MKEGNVQRAKAPQEMRALVSIPSVERYFDIGIIMVFSSWSCKRMETESAERQFSKIFLAQLYPIIWISL